MRDHAVGGSGAAGAEVVDASQRLQVLQDFFKSTVQLRDGSVHMDLDGHEFSGYRVKAAALGLRQGDGAFSFIFSHFALLGGDLVRERSVVTHRTLPVWLSLGPSPGLLLALFLIAGLPAISNLGQQGPNLFDLLFTPKAYPNVAHFHHRRERNLLIGDVTIDASEADAQLLGGLTSGIFHSRYDIYQIVQAESSGLLLRLSRSSSVVHLRAAARSYRVTFQVYSIPASTGMPGAPYEKLRRMTTSSFPC